MPRHGDSSGTHGLQPLLRRCAGKTVLDIGCAEGAIGYHLLQAGAATLHGIDRDPTRISMAQRKTRLSSRVEFWCAKAEDLDQLPLAPAYDLVLLLAILHKLKLPEAVLAMAAARTTELLAICLPDPVIRDARSGFREIDVPSLLVPLFRRIHAARRRDGAWVGLFERSDAP